MQIEERTVGTATILDLRGRLAAIFETFDGEADARRSFSAAV
jgi:hypothetical protein